MSSTNEEKIIEEVQALEAILLRDVVVKRLDDALKYQIETVVHPIENPDEQYVCVTLVIMLLTGYPDVSPEVQLKNPRGLDERVVQNIQVQIQKKLEACLGQPVVFELIALVRDCLTASNYPSGPCVICLFPFHTNDVFTKTVCYHFFHSHCLANHLIAGKKYYKEELDSLPQWQQVKMPQYQQTCPVCRAELDLNVDRLKAAPMPLESMTEPDFFLTDELRQRQMEMAQRLEIQMARGGVVTSGDDGPPLINITSLSLDDNDRDAGASTSREPVAGPSRARDDQPGPSAVQPRQPYRGPYRGFNRRGKGGRRGRGAR